MDIVVPTIVTVLATIGAFSLGVLSVQCVRLIRARKRTPMAPIVCDQDGCSTTKKLPTGLFQYPPAVAVGGYIQLTNQWIIVGEEVRETGHVLRTYCPFHALARIEQG